MTTAKKLKTIKRLTGANSRETAKIPPEGAKNTMKITPYFKDSQARVLRAEQAAAAQLRMVGLDPTLLRKLPTGLQLALADLLTADDILEEARRLMLQGE